MDADLPGLPPGTLDHAVAIARNGAALLTAMTGAEVTVDDREVVLQVLLPVVMAASYGTTHREPAAPLAVGNGYVAADLASADEEDTFARMLASLGARAGDAMAVADEAQQWRLPVCAFVSGAECDAGPTSRVADPGSGDHAVVPRGVPPLQGITVCDLTAMWAGPLATWLLASLGAEVHKIEPGVRADGMRGTPPMFAALNRGKIRRDLDLRDGAARAELDDLIARSDVVIDSFSRRVMPNLGLTPERLRSRNRQIVTVSMPAFPVGHRWQLALGPGVHAASGLGDLGDGTFAAPLVAYPDPVAGLAAFVEVLDALRETAAHGAVAHREVTLFGAIAPLRNRRAPSKLVAERDPELGQRLRDDPSLADAWRPITADGRCAPRTPFCGPWHSVALASAPALRRDSAAMR